MEGYEFEARCEKIKSIIDRYDDPDLRLAGIIGYLRGIDSDTVLTAGQVSQILALRYPEKE